MKPISLKIYRQNNPERLLEIVIGKKNIKKSVTRNLIKRRLRAILRPYLAADKKIVVVVGPGADILSFAELKNLIESELK
jgi:ribonuclease P protein component